MNIWEKSFQLLKENKRLIFLKVLWHKGSSPGKQGFSMIVSDDDFLMGSIGGGRTEFQMVEEAKKMLKESTTKTKFKKQVHRENDMDSSGMICAGEQWVVLKPLDSSHISIIEKILTDNGLLVLTNNSFEWNQNEITQNYQFDFQSEDKWIYFENCNKKPVLYIVGGGHVGLATAKLFKELDFEIHLFDDRKGLNTFEQNTFIESKQIIDYQNIRNNILPGNKTYIVILTHNFMSDSQVLAALEGISVKYIGVLGSKSKVNSMFKTLKNEGVSEDYLKSIDAPIGISINSTTPTEIAVSIAAKIISVKNLEQF